MFKKAVDNGNFRKLDDLVDLIIYENEYDAYYKYIELAAETGNLKAEYVCDSRLPSPSLKKLWILKDLYDRGFKEAFFDYECEKKNLKKI